MSDESDDLVPKSLEQTVVDEIQRREIAMRDAIGGVATAFTSIDGAVDALGTAFTGVSAVWRLITAGMTVGPKLERIEKLAKTFIEDEELKRTVLSFFKELKPLVERRNAALHRAHMVLAQGILRMKQGAGRKIETEYIELDEFTTLEAALIDLYERHGSLFVDLSDHVWPIIQDERKRERSTIVTLPVEEALLTFIDPETGEETPF